MQDVAALRKLQTFGPRRPRLALDSLSLKIWEGGQPEVFDGMIAADGQLHLSLMNGQVLCLDK